MVTAYPIGIVWLDGKEAQVHEFGATSVHSEHIFPYRSGGDGSAGDDRPPPATPSQRSRYFRDIVSAMDDAERVVVVGPDAVRVEFVQYAEQQAPSFFDRIVHTSQYPRPKHGELLVFARAFM